MPPRYAYWTILVDGGPTAFRAAEPDELLPTLKRLQVKQPGAVMKWFEKGKLWESREEAKDKLTAGYTVGPDGTLIDPPEGFERRTKSWRPGGEHRDPREKYLLAKKAKWQKFKKMVRARPGHGPKPEEDVFAPLTGDEPIDQPHDSEPESFEQADSPVDDGFVDAPPPASTDWRGRPKPEGDAPAPRRAWSDRPKTFDRGGDRPRGPRPEWRDRPQGGGGGGWRGKPAGGGGGSWTPRPEGDRPRGPKPEWRDRPVGDDRPRAPRPEWRDRPKSFDRPAGDDRPRAPRPEWRDKPAGGGYRGKPAGGGGSWTPRPDGDRPRGPKPEWRDRPKSFDRPAGDDRPRGPKPEWRDRPKSFDRPAGDDRPRAPRPEWRDKPAGGGYRGKPAGGGGSWTPRPDGDRPRGPKPEWRDRPKSFDRPAGDDRPRGPKPEWRDRPKSFDRPAGDRPRGPKPEWRDRPKTFDRPAGDDRPRGPKPEWRDRPAGDRPPSDRPRGPKSFGGKPGGFGRKPGGFGGGGARGRSGPPKKKY